MRSAWHGSWYFSADLPSAAGERRRVRRGGFATRADAVAALEALGSPAGPEAGLLTGEWLVRWLGSRVSLRASTSRSYAAHVRCYLVPYLGGISLAALTPSDVQAMFTAVIGDETALGHPVSAATVHRIHATLRAALNGAVRAGLIAVNPGRWPELPRAVRPRPQVWTPALAQRWQDDGWRPPVGVWTAAQTGEFLRQVRGHRLYALFHLVALRGLRRGEAAGLSWSDLDLDAGTLTVTGQLQQLGGRLIAGPPKSDAGRRVIALDSTTIAALREHRLRQQAERAAAGTRWAGTGYVFTTPAGKPVAPDQMTRLFANLVAYPPLAVRQPDGSQVPLGRPAAPVTLYRGSSPERRRRMSWASEPSLAEEFGARHAHFDAAALYQAPIVPDAILAYLERRDEGWTVVVDPAGLTNIEKLRDIHGHGR